MSSLYQCMMSKPPLSLSFSLSLAYTKSGFFLDIIIRRRICTAKNRLEGMPSFMCERESLDDVIYRGQQYCKIILSVCEERVEVPVSAPSPPLPSPFPPPHLNHLYDRPWDPPAPTSTSFSLASATLLSQPPRISSPRV